MSDEVKINFGSVSDVQRKMNVGYTVAVRIQEIIKKLEAENEVLKRFPFGCDNAEHFVDEIQSLQKENSDLKRRVALLERDFADECDATQELNHKNIELSTICESLAGALESYHSAYEIMRDDGENYWIRMQNNYPQAQKALAKFKEVIK